MFRNRKPAKGKKIRIKNKSFLAVQRRDVHLGRDDMIVEFRRPSTKGIWLEVWRRPQDNILRHPDLEQSIMLDGRLSGNGGQFVTIDADLGVQTDYALGQVAIPIEEDVEVPVLDDKGKVVGTQKQKRVTRLEVAETREWIGIGGSTTWQNEQDLSFAQIQNANNMDMIKMLKNVVLASLVMQALNVILIIVLAAYLLKDKVNI